MNEFAKIFRHIVFDIFNFCIAGFVTFLNILYIDFLFNECKILHYIKEINYWEIIMIGVCYILGHATSCVMYIICDRTFIQKWTCKLITIRFKDKDTEIADKIKTAYEKEIDAFKNHRDLFEQFPLRYKQLYYIRWNIAAAFFVTGVSNFIYSLLYSNFNRNLSIVSGVLIFLGFLQYMLVLLFEKDTIDRLEKINN
jgi:hypothetical protein